MRNRLMIAVLGGAMMVAPGLTPQARASHDWFAIGTAFRVGAAYISFAFGQPSYYGYAPPYYYRFDRPVHYREARCSRQCFHEAGYYYHHDSCPLVATHFRHYGVDPYWAYDRYAPRYGGYDRGYGYYDQRSDYGHRDYRGDYGYYDDRGRDRYYDRYDGHRRYDRDSRYDRDRGHRGRGRGHKHHRGCGHY